MSERQSKLGTSEAPGPSSSWFSVDFPLSMRPRNAAVRVHSRPGFRMGGGRLLAWSGSAGDNGRLFFGHGSVVTLSSKACRHDDEGQRGWACNLGMSSGFRFLNRVTSQV